MHSEGILSTHVKYLEGISIDNNSTGLFEDNSNNSNLDFEVT